MVGRLKVWGLPWTGKSVRRARPRFPRGIHRAPFKSFLVERSHIWERVTCNDVLLYLAPLQLMQGLTGHHLVHISRYEKVLEQKIFSDLNDEKTSGPRSASLAQLITAPTPKSVCARSANLKNYFFSFYFHFLLCTFSKPKRLIIVSFHSHFLSPLFFVCSFWFQPVVNYDMSYLEKPALFYKNKPNMQTKLTSPCFCWQI